MSKNENELKRFAADVQDMYNNIIVKISQYSPAPVYSKKIAKYEIDLLKYETKNNLEK